MFCWDKILQGKMGCPLPISFLLDKTSQPNTRVAALGPLPTSRPSEDEENGCLSPLSKRAPHWAPPKPFVLNIQETRHIRSCYCEPRFADAHKEQKPVCGDTGSSGREQAAPAVCSPRQPRSAPRDPSPATGRVRVQSRVHVGRREHGGCPVCLQGRVHVGRLSPPPPGVSVPQHPLTF